MKRMAILVAVMIFVTTMVFITESYGQWRKKMKLTSESFNHGEMMDKRFGYDHDNTLPQLSWSGVPKGTKSFAISCIDPDAPVGDFVHWMVYNIPLDVTSIPEGGPIPAGIEEVVNDYRKPGYGGPCPPSGTHRYYYTVYALRKDNLTMTTKHDFLRQTSEYTILKGQIMGKYNRGM